VFDKWSKYYTNLLLLSSRYVKCLIQEFNIKVDKGFMLSLYDVFADLVTYDQSEVRPTTL